MPGHAPGLNQGVIMRNKPTAGILESTTAAPSDGAPPTGVAEGHREHEHASVR